MGKNVDRITPGGEKTLFVNGIDMTEAQYMDALVEMKQEILKRWEGSIVFVHATRAGMTGAIVDRAKEVAAVTKAKGIPDGLSVPVGLSGLQKSVAQLFGGALTIPAQSKKPGNGWPRWMTRSAREPDRPGTNMD